MYHTTRLKQNFREGPKTGPHVASVRSAEVRGLLAQVFPHSPSSAVEVTKLMRLAFPACESQRDTKGQKETFYVGVERLMASQLFSTATTSLEVQLSYKDAEIEMLRARVQELEGQVHNQQQSPMAQQAVGSLSLYKDELQSLVSSSRMISDGPVTTEGLDSFSLSGLITEVRQIAPSFFSLLCDLGDVRRNADEADTLTQNELKALMSLCVLANARSRQTKGVQLFISLMLIARAVNKQVHIIINVYVHVHVHVYYTE